jgi:hypothetical protein
VRDPSRISFGLKTNKKSGSKRTAYPKQSRTPGGVFAVSAYLYRVYAALISLEAPVVLDRNEGFIESSWPECQQVLAVFIALKAKTPAKAGVFMFFRNLRLLR